MSQDGEVPEIAAVEESQDLTLEQINEIITGIFLDYTSGIPEMDNRTFVKLFKDNGLVDKETIVTTYDLIFAKIKVHGAKKIRYDQFRESLTLIAEKKKGWTVHDVEDQIIHSAGPQYKGTYAVPTSFYDDKTKFTGTAARPAGDAAGYKDLGGLINRDRVLNDQLNRNKHGGKVPEDIDRVKAKAAAAKVSPPAGAAKAVPKKATAQSITDRLTSKDNFTGVHKNGGPDIGKREAGAKIYPPTAPKPKTAAPKATPKTKATGEIRGPERFFYDKSTYTGKTGNPGGKDVTENNVKDLSQLTRGAAMNDQMHRAKNGGKDLPLNNLPK